MYSIYLQLLLNDRIVVDKFRLEASLCLLNLLPAPSDMAEDSEAYNIPLAVGVGAALN
jgi:hypothetical protein